jgi:hypothetical protein
MNWTPAPAFGGAGRHIGGTLTRANTSKIGFQVGD